MPLMPFSASSNRRSFRPFASIHQYMKIHRRLECVENLKTRKQPKNTETT
ncbi:hypothetical protein HMPREF0972_01443 [Actinomyces sp. oral taxon 848 str. F0332]|nr:hypothetical protein HMPREF0972_01443 [Actinomyces sp. oral taxon 848 str. F0332]